MLMALKDIALSSGRSVVKNCKPWSDIFKVHKTWRKTTTILLIFFITFTLQSWLIYIYIQYTIIKIGMTKLLKI